MDGWVAEELVDIFSVIQKKGAADYSLHRGRQEMQFKPLHKKQGCSDIDFLKVTDSKEVVFSGK